MLGGEGNGGERHSTCGLGLRALRPNGLRLKEEGELYRIHRLPRILFLTPQKSNPDQTMTKP
jgi:hypothetical protein